MTNAHCSDKPVVKQVRLGNRGVVATNNFITKSKAVHGDKFTYENIKYTNPNKKAQLTCRVHGEISIHARVHLQGHGCAECTRDNHPKRFTSSQFISIAKKVHGERYDYSLVSYRDKYKPVKVICEYHGVFEQRPSTHLDGSGCSKCYGNKKLTTELFISKARAKHGDRYNYSLVDFKSTKHTVDIICDMHGVFQQLANIHLTGSGCPTCAYRGGFTANGFSASCEKNKGQGLLYIIRCWIDGESFYKVGITSTSVDTRFKSDMPYSYSVVYEVFEEARIVYDLEKNIHKLLRNYTHEPSINFGGKTECFSTIAPVRKLIERLVNTQQLQLIA